MWAIYLPESVAQAPPNYRTVDGANLFISGRGRGCRKPAHQDLALANGIRRTDDTLPFHTFHEIGSPAVADRKPALQVARRRLAIAQNDGDSLLVEITLAALPAACRPEILGFLRSEEHTSELQSRPHLVCRLLLEK